MPEGCQKHRQCDKKQIFLYSLFVNIQQYLHTCTNNNIKYINLHKHIQIQMQQQIIQSYKIPIRTFMLRMEALCQQSSKFSLIHSLDEIDSTFSRLLHGEDIKQSLIYQLTNVEIKSQQHCLLIMTLLYDLAKWVIDVLGDCMAVNKYQEQKQDKDKNAHKNRSTLQCGIQISTVQCIINQSLNILKQQKKHQTLISKNSQLTRILLQLIPIYLPIAVKHYSQNQNNHNNTKNSNTLVYLFDTYVTLYDMLGQTKQSYTLPSRQQIRKNYNRAIENSLKTFGNLFAFVILQTPTLSKYQTIHEIINHSHCRYLLELLIQIMKYLQYVHMKLSDDLYKFGAVFNTIGLMNPVVSNNINNTVIPTQSLMAIYPEMYSLYNGNYNEIILSRLKLLKIIIDILQLSSNMQLTQTLYKLPSSKSNNYQKQSQYQKLKNKLYYHEHILHTISHTLIQINGYVKVYNYYIIGIIFSMYDKITILLMKKNSMVCLYLYTHIIMGNLKILMDINNKKILNSTNNNNNTNNINNSNILLIPHLHVHFTAYSNSITPSSNTPNFSQLVILQTLLTEVSNIFNKNTLEYFLKLYDWNFMEEDVCLNSIKYLYEFIENSDNQVRLQYQLFKRCLTVINRRIQAFLTVNSQPNNILSTLQKLQHEKQLQNTKKKGNRQRKQFYQLKKKQYLYFVQKINKKPKQLFKTIAQMTNNNQQQIKQQYIQKCIRIIRKSNHINQKVMLDFMAAPAPQSNQILQKYIQTFFNKNKEKNGNVNNINSSVQHFLRYIISNFFLAGQAQQIVRFIDKVTVQFFKHQNPQTNIFKNSDAVYTFANAIILLNADQHNPKNPNRMSLQAFMKMCEKINAGQNLPAEIIKQTYKNIKQSQILSFRNRQNMQKISLECWMDIVNDYESVQIGFYDHQMAEICNQDKDQQGVVNIEFRQFANQLLLSVIDQKQTQKLQVMIERFEYDDRKFDCQIIQKIRVMIVNKKHISMHALQKIYEQADFKNKKIDQKMLSYTWLAAGVIQNFYDTLPYSKIAQCLLRTWRIGFQIKDNLIIRQNLEQRIIQKCLKQHKKKQSKKSIMDMFSKFLTSKDSDNQDNAIQQQSSSSLTTNARRKANIINSSFNIMKLMMKNKDSRARAAQTVLFSLRHEQSRRFQQFIACLYLIFHFVFGQGVKNQNNEEGKEGEGIQNPISSECLKILINLLQDFYSLSEPHQIGSRIVSLKTRDNQKYQLVYCYTQLWTLKILFTWTVHRLNNNYNQEVSLQTKTKVTNLYKKCQDLLPKLNPQILNQLLEIIDVENMNIENLQQNSQITKQLLLGLKSAIEQHKIKTKYVNFKNKQILESKQYLSNVVNKTKSEPTLSKQSSIEQTEQHIKQLKMTAIKSQGIISQIPKQNQNKQPETKIQQQNKNQQQIKLIQGQNAQITDDIQQRIKEQLGLNFQDSIKIQNQGQDNNKKIQNIVQQSQLQTTNLKVQKIITQTPCQKPSQKNEQRKAEQEKRQVKSNSSGEDMSLPIYML